MKFSAATFAVLATALASKLAFVSALPMPFGEDDMNLSVEMRDDGAGTEDVWARDLFAQLLDEINARDLMEDDDLLYARYPMNIPPHYGLFPKVTDMAKHAGGRKLTQDLSKDISKSGSGGQGPKLPITRQDVSNAIKKPQPGPSKPAVPNAAAVGRQTQKSFADVAHKVHLQKQVAKKWKGQ